MTIERMYTPKEASEVLRVSIRTLWRYIARGKATNGKEGLSPITRRESGHVLIPEQTLKNYLERLQWQN